MKINLISYTTISDDLALINGGDLDLKELVAYCARVSNPTNQLAEDRDDDKLINYLLKNKHFSPFEMVNVCLEIETTRDIARQILRHRSFTFQEFSQRYAEVPMEPEYREVRLQDKKNRQNSIPVSDAVLAKWWKEKQKDVWDFANQTYKAALDYGIAKEVARAVLPEGLTPSTILVNGTLRSWIHYISLRSGNGTQKEHKAIAIACADVISRVFPNIMNFVEKE